MTLWLAAAGLVVVAAGLVIVAGGGGGDDESTGLPTLPIGAGSGAPGAAGSTTAQADAAPEAADMTLLPAVAYVPGEGLPALGGEAPAYQLRSDVDADAVARLAEALGIDGEPAQRDEMWHVEDGERVLDVYGTEGSWSTYLVAPAVSADGVAGVDGSAGVAASDPVPPVAELSPDEIARLCPTVDPQAVEEQPAAEQPADDGGSGVAGSTGAADLTACEEPPAGEPVPTEPFEPPTRPENLPSQDEARSIALDVLAATGVDVDDADVTVDDGITEWFVTVEPKIGGLPAPGLSMYVGVGDEGAITMASGYLAQPEELGKYPLLDTSAALERLNEQYAHAYSGVDTATAAEPAVDAARAAESAVEPSSSPPATEPGIVSIEEVPPPRDLGEDLPVLTVPPDAALPPDTTVPPDEPPPTEPQPDPTVVPTEPPPPTEPVAPPEVEVTDAELVLLMEVAWDGSGTYLVPGYRFTAEDDSAPVVTAVVDDLVEPPPADQPRTLPGDVPTDDGGGDPGDGDVPVEEPAVAPDTPVGDQPATDAPAVAPDSPEPRPATP